METRSEIGKEYIINNKNNDIKIATISDFDKSSYSEIKKGSIDIYGNIINYDPNDWIGEDFEIEKETIKSQDFKIDENYGTLDVSIPNYIDLNGTNIELTIIDEVYNVHNIYIYYVNDYHEKIRMNEGKYKINNISFFGLDGSNYVLSTKEFNIINGETTQLTIDRVYNLEKNVATSTEIAKFEEKHQKRNGSSIFSSMILFAIIGIISFLIIKKRKKKDE